MSEPIRRCDGASIETRVGSDIVVMRLSDGDYFELSASAAAIWELIDGTRDREALLAVLRERYGDGVSIARETDAFLAQLREAGLVAANG